MDDGGKFVKLAIQSGQMANITMLCEKCADKVRTVLFDALVFGG
jgi:hypothetical protein